MSGYTGLGVSKEDPLIMYPKMISERKPEDIDQGDIIIVRARERGPNRVDLAISGDNYFFVRYSKLPDNIRAAVNIKLKTLEGMAR